MILSGVIQSLSYSFLFVLVFMFSHVRFRQFVSENIHTVVSLSISVFVFACSVYSYVVSAVTGSWIKFSSDISSDSSNIGIE